MENQRMPIPIINNRNREQYLLYCPEEDVSFYVESLKNQNIIVRYVCAPANRGLERYYTLSNEETVEFLKNSTNTTLLTTYSRCSGEVQFFINNNVKILFAEELANDKSNKKRCCHFEELYVDRYGYLYPCCKTFLHDPIGHISESDIVNKWNNYSPTKECICGKGKLSKGTWNSSSQGIITFELSSACNANCSYCFQNDENKGEAYKYYTELYDFINMANIDKVIFSGGEILTQKEAILFIEKLKQEKPSTWIHLKSNGFHSASKAGLVNSIFDSINVTLNGFSTATCKTIMKADFLTIKTFCETLANGKKVSVGLKYLCSPANIIELPDFLRWCCDLELDRVIVPTARVYNAKPDLYDEWNDSSFSGINMAFWREILLRVGSDCKDSIETLQRKKISFRIDKELSNLLGLEV